MVRDVSASLGEGRTSAAGQHHPGTPEVKSHLQRRKLKAAGVGVGGRESWGGPGLPLGGTGLVTSALQQRKLRERRGGRSRETGRQTQV